MTARPITRFTVRGPLQKGVGTVQVNGKVPPIGAGDILRLDFSGEMLLVEFVDGRTYKVKREYLETKSAPIFGREVHVTHVGQVAK